MSIEATLDGQEETARQIATTLGWTEFSAWVAQLEPQPENLRQLIEYGESDEPALIVQELTAALEAGDPSDDERGIADALLKVLATRSDDRAVVIVG